MAMVPSPSPSSPSNLAIAAFLSLLLISYPTKIDSFQLSRIPNDGRSVASSSSSTSWKQYPHCASSSRRYQTVDMPRRPMEEEREKNSNRSNNNSGGGDNGDSDTKEWKQVVGGFVPRFLKRGGAQDGGAGNNDETSTTTKKNPYTTVQLVDTLEDYKRVVVDERDHIVVVRFFAPWCKSCKAALPLFKKMAWDHSPTVKFVEVPLTKETAYIHEGLGVPSVPFGHIYHPEVGLVEEMKINKKVFKGFRETLDDYVRGSCDLPEDEEEKEIEEYLLIDDDGFQ